MARDTDIVEETLDPPGRAANNDGGAEGDDGDGGAGPWVTVATFTTPEAAHLARVRLEAEDIPVFVADEHIAGTAWHYALATGGVKVQVPAPDATRADALLCAAVPAPAAGDERESSSAPTNDIDCPKCGSPETHGVRFTSRRVAGLVLLTFVATSVHPVAGLALLAACVWLIVRSAERTCATCGHDWSVRRAAARRGFPVTPIDRRVDG